MIKRSNIIVTIYSKREYIVFSTFYILFKNILKKIWIIKLEKKIVEFLLEQLLKVYVKIFFSQKNN